MDNKNSIHIKDSLHNLLGDAGEDLWMFGGELGENFAVELDAGLFQFIDEGAVGLVAVLAKSGIEADNPELAEDSLLVAAVCEGVASSAHERLVRVTFLLGTNAAVALGSLQDIFAALLRHDASFDSCHTKIITSRIN